MLRNREENEESLIRGVNLAARPTTLKLGYFQSLQNWIPAKKYKIKKKRGVTTLQSGNGDWYTSPTAINIPVTCGDVGAGGSLDFTCGSCPVGQFAAGTYAGGSQLSGPAIRISSTATPIVFYGLGAIYAPASGKIFLVWWNGTSLDHFDTIVGTATRTLVNGDVLKLSSVGAYDFTVYVNADQVITVTGLTTVNASYPCYGWVAPIST